jgi:hypothetical protein
MERISRKDDENLYQPKIHSRRIRDLHHLSVQTGLPMTVLVDEALRRIIKDLTSIPYPDTDAPKIENLKLRGE